MTERRDSTERPLDIKQERSKYPLAPPHYTDQALRAFVGEHLHHTVNTFLEKAEQEEESTVIRKGVQSLMEGDDSGGRRRSLLYACTVYSLNRFIEPFYVAAEKNLERGLILPYMVYFDFADSADGALAALVRAEGVARHGARQEAKLTLQEYHEEQNDPNPLAAAEKSPGLDEWTARFQYYYDMLFHERTGVALLMDQVVRLAAEIQGMKRFPSSTFLSSYTIPPVALMGRIFVFNGYQLIRNRFPAMPVPTESGGE